MMHIQTEKIIKSSLFRPLLGISENKHAERTKIGERKGELVRGSDIENTLDTFKY